MLRISKICDYAVVVMIELCSSDSEQKSSTRVISERTHLPQPTVSKVMKLLLKGGLVQAHRGLCGGYQLSGKPEDIRLLQIIECVDGPIALTTCTVSSSIKCETHAVCRAGPHWPVINQAVVDALSEIRLTQFLQSPNTLTRLNGPLSHASN